MRDADRESSQRFEHDPTHESRSLVVAEEYIARCIVFEMWKAGFEIELEVIAQHVGGYVECNENVDRQVKHVMERDASEYLKVGDSVDERIKNRYIGDDDDDEKEGADEETAE